MRPCIRAAPRNALPAGRPGARRRAPAEARAAPTPQGPSAAPNATLPGAAAPLDIGIASIQGPRPAMEDALCMKRVGDDGELTYAAIFDGHGGILSAQWLRQELPRFVIPRLAAAGLPLDLTSGSAAAAGEGSRRGGSEPWRAPPGLLEAELAGGVTWPAVAGRVLGEAFKEADAQLISYLKEVYGLQQIGASGATALVALLQPGAATFVSLGDCLAVICRGGKAEKVTLQHRVHGLGPGVLEEMERVEAAGGWVVDGRVCSVLAVSRAFGDPEFKGDGLRVLLREGARKGLWTEQFAEEHAFVADPVIVEPDVTQIVFGPDDEFLLMATDGLWDAAPPADAVATARKRLAAGAGAQGAAEALADLALRRYTTDNVTVVCVDLWASRHQGGGGASSNGSSGGGGGNSGGSNGGGGNGGGGLFGGGGGGGWLGGLFGGR